MTQLTIKVPNFGPKNSNFACKSQIFRISFQKMLRSFGLGLGLETFAKFLRVSVSKNLVSEKKSRFRFRKNLVSEKSLGFGFGKFGLGRKVSVSVSEKFGLGKKSRFRFRKIWYRKKSLGIGFGQNFGIVIQCFPKISRVWKTGTTMTERSTIMGVLLRLVRWSQDLAVLIRLFSQPRSSFGV